MATLSITDLSGRTLSEVTDLSPKTTFSRINENKLSSITHITNRRIGWVNQEQYPRSTFSSVVFSKISASQILPFRISFESIGVKPYDNQYTPPVGIQVIGFNNYIL